jgi:HTH-type transcriptional regulator, transcriptional repressor of NAD biosynthesis genes
MKPRRAFVLGKFLPPHLGHCYLIEEAARQSEHLTVVVGSLAAEPIPGALRVDWLRRIFSPERWPRVEIVPLTDENPQNPEEHPDFWNIWEQSLRRVVGAPDAVFSSESYGDELARRMGCAHILIDLERKHVPVSGTAVRNAPLLHWDFLPEIVRPYFVKKVLITGPESTGKSTLARMLAERFQTVYAHEYAREYIDRKGAWIEAADIPNIANGQLALEDGLLRKANRFLFCDTDLVATKIYSEHYLGSCPPAVIEAANEREHDLNLLLDIDVPWVADPQRLEPWNRPYFFDWFRRELEERKRPYVRIRGAWEERMAHAVQAVEALLSAPMNQCAQWRTTSPASYGEIQ